MKETQIQSIEGSVTYSYKGQVWLKIDDNTDRSELITVPTMQCRLVLCNWWQNTNPPFDNSYEPVSPRDLKEFTP